MFLKTSIKMMPIRYLFYSGTSTKKGLKALSSPLPLINFPSHLNAVNTTCSSHKRMTKLSSKSEFSWSCMLLEYNKRSNVTIVEKPGARELFTF